MFASSERQYYAHGYTMADVSVDTDVTRLLAASRAAHLQYRVAANPTLGHPNYPLAEQRVKEAMALRQQAHDLDPKHSAAGWAEDRVPHDRIMEFYAKYGDIP